MQLNPQEWAHFLSTATGVLVGGSFPAGAVIIFVWKMMRKFDIFLVEHEMLMGDYAKARNIRIEELPTRSGRFRNGD